MSLFFSLFLLLVGLAILVLGGEGLVRGAEAIARRYRVPEMVIGLTLVSMGTSLPELVVSLYASIQGSPDIAIGNVIGSNIANILLILGVAVLIRPQPIRLQTLYSEIPFSLAAAILVGFLANAALFSPGSTQLIISRADGGILLFFFVLFLAYIARNMGEEELAGEPQVATLSLPKAWLSIGGGLVALVLGGKLAVDGAIDLAQTLGMSESLIGLTVVSIGTSLPELVTSAVAAYRGRSGLAVGNVIGSNIFNLLWILGLSAVVHPLPFNEINNDDLLVLIFTSTLIIFSMAVGTKQTLDRWQGAGFLLAYVAYLVFLVLRSGAG